MNTTPARQAATSRDLADQVDLPLGLDPTKTPIIATHFFGWRPPSAEVIDFDLMRLARALHTLGIGVSAKVGSRLDVLKRLEAFADLDDGGGAA
jgi:hypothetical protein